ncbi:DNA polymerase III subunit beta [Pseudohongiella sp. SYSU M77423]|uniref:DNA polymerase III subunit beta n=1 Tax=Pseudohongiella sp. SYSU M77423 TaxID=3042312 RepID=UPI0024814941|nr:DNA polymerase III subunit beta [Pseudohongiella sp. SYSU M77423]MDH7944265.1 DNA polymerase III subunit beta [Pseudohongiella sp. SYSU M77423]MEC8859717.1 DNA polymerase III subunit beta [Pseudomonadota bacterium]
MQFTITREAILKPLQLAAGVVERRHTLPVLANVLLTLKSGVLEITGTDLEVELIGRVRVNDGSSDGEVTVPGRKLLDICKSLPDNSELGFSVDDNKFVVKAGRSRFTLATLPATDFPVTSDEPGTFEVRLQGSELKSLIDSCAFAMAQQDVRYYLNGMLFEVGPSWFRVVATDGHRLAMHTSGVETGVEELQQIIVPRKGVLELSRLLSEPEEDQLVLMFGLSHVRVKLTDFTFTSKLVDGKFPDYQRVLPKGGDKVVLGDRSELRQAFNRASILSNEKYRGVHLQFNNDELKVVANNPEQEEAEDTVGIEYQGETLEIGFNVSYLLDVLNVLDSDKVKFTLADSNSSALVEAVSASDALYVVMPMRL